MAAPPGWPPDVPPPEAEGWELRAAAWLFDQCPPDYRAYDVFRRHPIVLAHAARVNLAAVAEAAETGVRTVRHDLGSRVPPETVDAAVTAYEHERHRLRAASVAADLIWRALRGERWSAKL
jgi:hypothetical protein